MTENCPEIKADKSSERRVLNKINFLNVYKDIL